MREILMGLSLEGSGAGVALRALPGAGCARLNAHTPPWWVLCTWLRPPSLNSRRQGEAPEVVPLSLRRTVQAMICPSLLPLSQRPTPSLGNQSLLPPSWATILAFPALSV